MALNAQVNQWRASKLNAGEKLSHVNDSRGGLCPVESLNQCQHWKCHMEGNSSAREAVGVFHDEGALQDAVDELLIGGFDRSSPRHQMFDLPPRGDINGYGSGCPGMTQPGHCGCGT
jgi:hypothetical protein